MIPKIGDRIRFIIDFWDNQGNVIFREGEEAVISSVAPFMVARKAGGISCHVRGDVGFVILKEKIDG